ncbi:MAG: type II secretion system F family protein [Candidatus Gastranaerophilales bacterium]|nr:type II secretion system F family protein [Candidatus Gastranaerophilales bacterium]
MPVYNYIALKNNSEVVKGKIEADDTRQARQQIRQLGYVPTKVYDTASNSSQQQTVNVAKLQSLSLKEKIDFTSTFRTLHKAGLPVVESLIFMENDASSRRIRLLAREIRKQIISGYTFSDTLAHYPQIFGQVYIGLAKAGEDSGEMERSFDRIIELLQKESDIRGRVVSALAYPSFVVVLAHVVVLIMLMFVFPAFKDMFDMMGKELPIFTRICMGAGEFLKDKWFVIPLGLGTLIWSVVYLWKWSVSRKEIDKLMLRIPLLSDLLKFSAFSNFLSVLQVAYEAGIPIVDCLYLSNLTFSNSMMHEAVNQAIKKVQGGAHLSVAMRSAKIFPKMILFMVATGEQSGKLGELMHQSVLYIDQELDRVIDIISKMIEPILLIFIGGIVCFLALSLYLPLFQSYQLA